MERFPASRGQKLGQRIVDVAAQLARLRAALVNVLTQRAFRRLCTSELRVVRSSDEADFEAVSEQRGGESDPREEDKGVDSRWSREAVLARVARGACSQCSPVQLRVQRVYEARPSTANTSPHRRPGQHAALRQGSWKIFSILATLARISYTLRPQSSTVTKSLTSWGESISIEPRARLSSSSPACKLLSTLRNRRSNSSPPNVSTTDP